MQKVYKKAGMIVLGLLVSILALYLLILAYFRISASMSWEEHRDIKDYGMLNNGENITEVFGDNDGGIWPETITERMEVQDYLLIYYNPWDANYLGMLTTIYDEEDYGIEINRLKGYPSTDYIGKYDVETFEKYELLAIKASDTGFIYALKTGEYTITYVGIVFPGYATDIEYRKYIPEEYLPKGLNIEKDNPTQQKMQDYFKEES